MHFRLQLLVAAAALGILLLLLRRPVLAVVALGLALPLLVPFLHTGPVAVAAPGCGATQFRVITANLHYSNQDHRRFSEWLLAHPADLVVAQEVTAAWAQSLRATAVAYPHSRIVAREDPYGMAVFSRWPMQVETVDLAVDGLPSMLVRIDAPDGPLQVLALHTRWPITPQLHMLRNRALDRAASLVDQDPTHTLLVGDLNLTPYAPRFARLLRDTGLQRCTGRPNLACNMAAGVLAAGVTDRSRAGAADHVRRQSRGGPGHRLRPPAADGGHASAIGITWMPCFFSGFRDIGASTAGRRRRSGETTVVGVASLVRAPGPRPTIGKMLETALALRCTTAADQGQARRFERKQPLIHQRAHIVASAWSREDCNRMKAQTQRTRPWDACHGWLS